MVAFRDLALVDILNWDISSLSKTGLSGVNKNLATDEGGAHNGCSRYEGSKSIVALVCCGVDDSALAVRWSTLASVVVGTLRGSLVPLPSAWRACDISDVFAAFWSCWSAEETLSLCGAAALCSLDVFTKSVRLFVEGLFWCRWASFASALVGSVALSVGDGWETLLWISGLIAGFSGLDRAAKRWSADPPLAFDCCASADRELDPVLTTVVRFSSAVSFCSDTLGSVLGFANAAKLVLDDFWLAIFALRLDKLDPAARICRSCDVCPILLRDDAVEGLGAVFGRPFCLWFTGNVESNANRCFRIDRLMSSPVMFALRWSWYRWGNSCSFGLCMLKLCYEGCSELSLQISQLHECKTRQGNGKAEEK